jgi:hypothetical protein
VNEGRRELNFSRWDIARRPERLWRKIVEEVREGEMPPALYVLAHPSARLPESERVALASWAATLPGAAASGEDDD